MSAIHSIYRLVNSTFELKDLVVRFSRLVCQIFNARYCTIILLDPTTRFSIFKCIIKGKKKYTSEKKERITNKVEKRIVDRLSYIRKDHLIGLPLVCGEMMGAIIVRRSNNEKHFDVFDQEILMTILEQAMIGIRNLQLYEEQQKMVLGSIKSLVTLLDMRVPQEYTHSSYFSKLVTELADQVGVDSKQRESLKYASLLHDAGKIDVPLAILTKTTKLTPKEYSIIQRHPVSGAHILRHLQALKPVVPIIMHHHERYDGTGYPSKLKKEQIPRGARIMAVADAFEAMVYGRPYRERMDIDVAIKEIKKKSGTQFDPQVVDAFLKISKKVARKYLQLIK